MHTAERELVFAEDLLDLALSQVESANLLGEDKEVDSHVLALLLDADERICRAYCRLLGIPVAGEGS